MKRKMKSFSGKKWAASLLVTALSVTAAAGCSSGGTTGQGEQPQPNGEKGAEKPLELTIMLPVYKTTMPGDNGPVVQEIEKYTNTDLKFEWVPNNSYPDKFNITLASGKLPKIMVVQGKLPSFINAVRTGGFWDLTPYLKDYKNLSQFNPIVQNNVSIDGKVYGLYRSRALGRYGVSYRKDWLDNLGMEIPKTIDEFYEMLKAFSEKDPDGNGKDDTYGMVISKYTGPFDIMQIWFGVPNRWGEDADGKLIPAHMTLEYLDALRFFKKLYDEKLINPDFAVMDTEKWGDPVVNGQAGVIVDVADQAARLDDKIHRALAQAGKDEPDRHYIDVFGAVEGPKGLRNMPTSGYAGMVSISKSGVKTEEELKKVLTFLDKMNDKTGQILATNGIEGRHYKVVEGGIEPSKDVAMMESELEGLNQILSYVPEDLALKVKQTPLREKTALIQKENEKIVVPNPAEPFDSTVYAQKGVQLDNIISDARTKYIVGQIDEQGVKDAIELWRKSGGDDYIKEINEMYQAVKKK
ncbi:extracellular solute-binding protein [Paenibacillus turpanensis]|uniref:extracellular solute-binding protein n=1 Tax=Paenibacillus turpanensis TaxID=2689078 RepID=UPI00140CA547|nr:extracellular solute-binding protein [Paenibacillus turpanensis]